MDSYNSRKFNSTHEAYEYANTIAEEFEAKYPEIQFNPSVMANYDQLVELSYNTDEVGVETVIVEVRKNGMSGSLNITMFNDTTDPNPYEPNNTILETDKTKQLIVIALEVMAKL